MNRKIAVPILLGVLLICGMQRMGHAASFSQNTATRSIAENTPADTNIGAPFTAQPQPEASTPITYSLEGTDAASFTIESVTSGLSLQGQLKTKAALDYETKSTYTVTIKATDDSSDTIAVTINVTNVNEAPTFPDTTTSRSVAENTPTNTNIGNPITATDPDGDTLTYTLSGTDAAAFSIDSTNGQLKTNASLDYETKSNYTVTVTATDSGTPGLTDTITVTINVTDVDEVGNSPPTFPGATTSRSVAENTPTNTNIGNPITATDPDGDTLTYTLSGTDAAAFSIDSTNGQLKTNASLDYETKSTYTVIVTATDTGTPGLTDTITVTINVTNIDEVGNNPPTFPGATTSRSVAENTPTNTNIGSPITATDPDGDTLTYTLSGTDAAAFSIDSTNGQLKTNASLDYDTKSNYTVTVTATDSGTPGLTDTITVTINVLDADESRLTDTTPEPEVKRRQVTVRCELGWAPQSQYQLAAELPKVIIYALEFEYDPERHGRYICKTIEIRTGDDSIENLAGWHLYLGTLYNQSHFPLKIPEEHSQIRDGVLRLTPDMLGLETFPCNTANGISHPLPGFHYVLKTDENLSVDTAYSCFLWGQTAYTTVNGVNVKSPRRVSSAALRKMETPRLERYISDNTGVYITYMRLDEFAWDRAVLSDWLLAPSESSAPGAPSTIQRKLGTTWGALKKE